MSILESVLQEELHRLETNVLAYQKAISDLPKGYTYIQDIGDRGYCYRKWREGNKIVSFYIGPEDSEESKKAKEQYQERKRLQENLIELKKEKKQLAKALRCYR